MIILACLGGLFADAPRSRPEGAQTIKMKDKPRVIMISTDRNIFNDDSSVRARMVEYGTICEELHIIIFSKKGFENKKISANVFLYPTNSFSRWFYVMGAVRIGKMLPKVDIVTAQDPFEAGLAGWRIARSQRARLQLQIHTDFLSPFFSGGSFLNKIRVWLAEFLLPRADGIRVVSRRIRDSLKTKNYKLKTTPIILPVFVDIESIRNRKPSFKLRDKYPQFGAIVLMVSRLTKEKNVDLAIKVMNKVIKEAPGTGLVIVGDGPQKRFLGLQAERYNLRNSVIFEGWQNDLAPYYKGADIFLNTSNYEGLGLSLLEAAASDCPIVTTDVGGAGDVLRKNEDALVCPVGDAECLSERIGRLIKFPKLRSQLVTRAQVSMVAFETNKEEYLRKMGESWGSAL